MRPSRPLLPLLVAALVGCGASSPRPESAPRGSGRVVDLEEMRITAKRTEDGGFEMDSYDARELFERANEHLHAERCERAVPLYDQLVEEFPSSDFASPALYNAGLCLTDLEKLEEAAARYAAILERYPESPDVEHATFQLAAVQVEREAWQQVIEAADALLARQDLDPDERVEAMARRAQGLLGLERLDAAERQAEEALRYARLRQGDDKVFDTYFLGTANFVLAETLRLRAAAIEIPEARVDTQRETLERRAQLMLDAQREYFDTMRKTDAHWAAAAGYRIGEMYDAFWQAIMSAPVPPPKSEMAEEHLPIYREEYRKELARLVKPLIRHSIRYWELTLMMVERTGVETEWKERIEEDLARARERLLEQPAGRGGLPSAGRAQDGTEEAAAGGPSEL